MKKLLLCAIMSLATLSFTACNEKENNNPDSPQTSTGSNTEGGEDISENGMKNEFGEGRLIIGEWYPSNYTSTYYTRITYVFYSDGECATEAFKYDNRQTGYWSYNPENRLLACSMGLVGAWQINMLNAFAMQAVDVSSQQSYSLTHDFGSEYKTHYVDINPKLIIGKWQTKDKSTMFEFTSGNYKFSKGDIVKTGTYKINYIKEAERYNYVYDGDVVITFDNNEKYNLFSLCGGYVWIESLYGSNQPKEFIGEFYYVTE